MLRPKPFGERDIAKLGVGLREERPRGGRLHVGRPHLGDYI